ncbi:hypothetical protein SSX86_007829 [Deinandra increscens subsp. villosa]|uniref:Patellin-1-6 C-terminal GOLD domain-containing protein n=1 Tax=Deinandra increscens subsp. villosa TaxID=3103831 RepID=A0AAP0DI33_9ASTR
MTHAVIVEKVNISPEANCENQYAKAKAERRNFEIKTIKKKMSGSIYEVFLYVPQLSIVKACTLVWEARVVGYEVTYGAEFMPVAADSYTVIMQKARKLSATTNELFKCDEPSKAALTFDNQTSKNCNAKYFLPNVLT